MDYSKVAKVIKNAKAVQNSKTNQYTIENPQSVFSIVMN